MIGVAESQNCGPKHFSAGYGETQSLRVGCETNPRRALRQRTRGFRHLLLQGRQLKQTFKVFVWRWATRSDLTRDGCPEFLQCAAPGQETTFLCLRPLSNPSRNGCLRDGLVIVSLRHFLSHLLPTL